MGIMFRVPSILTLNFSNGQENYRIEAGAKKGFNIGVSVDTGFSSVCSVRTGWK